MYTMHFISIFVVVEKENKKQCQTELSLSHFQLRMNEEYLLFKRCLRIVMDRI